MTIPHYSWLIYPFSITVFKIRFLSSNPLLDSIILYSMIKRLLLIRTLFWLHTLHLPFPISFHMIHSEWHFSLHHLQIFIFVFLYFPFLWPLNITFLLASTASLFKMISDISFMEVYTPTFFHLKNIFNLKLFFFLPFLTFQLLIKALIPKLLHISTCILLLTLLMEWNSLWTLTLSISLLLATNYSSLPPIWIWLTASWSVS
jgi:hypothetical protein